MSVTVTLDISAAAIAAIPPLHLLDILSSTLSPLPLLFTRSLLPSALVLLMLSLLIFPLYHCRDGVMLW